MNKKDRPTCPRCKHPKYWVYEAEDGRPQFECDKCHHIWTNGRKGGEYFNFAEIRE